MEIQEVHLQMIFQDGILLLTQAAQGQQVPMVLMELLEQPDLLVLLDPLDQLGLI
jgi:hypothetical protein